MTWHDDIYFYMMTHMMRFSPWFYGDGMDIATDTPMDGPTLRSHSGFDICDVPLPWVVWLEFQPRRLGDTTVSSRGLPRLTPVLGSIHDFFFIFMRSKNLYVVCFQIIYININVLLKGTLVNSCFTLARRA